MVAICLTRRVDRRAQCVRQLCLMDDWDTRRHSTMPAVATPIVLGSQSSSLLPLQLTAQDVGLAGANCAALMALTRLRCLQVWRQEGNPISWCCW